ncbi:S-layer domain-containing protein [Syntrophobotulus glycolicus DSM 8271]|uniref:S-layer domain-containing protein n=1 Tax=Syntrophobotulus glycolicus (strain DSM 8271 / FlGlyR) TaxID=645991 RepID=F0T1W0_SYNGF|nr:S-layer homology domain-containing protein [Syntrophobotulus glycolicus]ADY55224.1 S-layer domain-containing protein [Syntrophobotulus glycolicus DSM 8271]
MNTHKPRHRLTALVLSALMVFGMTPAPAQADGTDGGAGEIIAFEALPAEVADRQTALGTALEDLALPGTLNATVRIATATGTQAQEEAESEESEPAEQGESVPDSGESAQAAAGSAVTSEESGDGTAPEVTESEISIPVTWVSAPDYDGDAAGTYTFTAEIEGFTLSAEPPVITVTVGATVSAAAARGIVTAFDALEDEVRWQSVENGTALEDLNLPQTLAATVEGEAAQVPVTWSAEPEYDATAKGLYIFTAQLAEGFRTTEEPPHIAVVVKAQQQQRMLLRSIGGGAQSTAPFLISTAAQLAEIAALTNAGRLESTFLGTTTGTVYLKLDNDIDLSGYAAADSGAGWTPIGTDTNMFLGQFDGDNHTISNLTINRGDNFQGLFGYIGGGTAQNLGVVNACVNGSSYVGGVAGRVNGGTVQNCYSTGSVSGICYVGGVAGWVNDGTVQDCYSTGSVSGTDDVGGVAGLVAGTVENCYSTGSVSGTDDVGGVAGVVAGGTVQDCYSTGSVSGTANYVGGVAGWVYGGTVQDCAALNPSVSGSTNVGRVAGSVYGSLSLNIAFSGMTVTVNGIDQTISDGAAGNKNGAATTAADLTADTGGVLSGLFTADGGWSYTSGKLPVLLKSGSATELMPGQDATLPAHISGTYFAGGTGASGDAYQISTAAQLAALAKLVNEGNTNYNAGTVYYELTNDLDLSGYTTADSGAGWTPIGNSANKFLGQFNGGNHTISNLTISRGSANYQGLFGAIGSGGTVQNLGVVNASVSGGQNVGGVAGHVSGGSGGTVENCHSTGSVSGSRFVGGVAGYVYINATVKNCYSTAGVSGGENVGGVAGSVYSVGATVENCYSTGSVSGGENVGGVAGSVYNVGATVKNCYSTSIVSGGSSVGGVAGDVSQGKVLDCAALNPSVSGSGDVRRVAMSYLGSLSGNIAFAGMTVNGSAVTGGAANGENGADTTAAQLTENTDTALSSRFTATGGWSYTAGKLPVLFKSGSTTECMPGQDDTLPAHLSGIYFNGGGTDTNPYQIATAAQLAALAKLVNEGNPTAQSTYNTNTVYYKLTNDLDLSGYAAADSSKGWTPVGNSTNQFKGSFDGNGKTITGLIINRTDDGLQGLFGWISSGTTVADLGVINVHIAGKDSVGAVAGYLGAGATVQNCYSTGSISGTNGIGGITGSVFGTVTDCYSAATVSGSGYVGGVAGYVEGGTVQSCYSTGGVSGIVCVGGVAGYVGINSTVQNCYSTGSVSGTDDVGGVAGYVFYGNVQSCYSTGSVSGNRFVGGVAGYVEGGTVQSCYSTGGVSGTSTVGGVAGKVDGGTVRDCAALNPTVSGNSAVGRVVAGYVGSSVLSNNYAYGGMTCASAGSAYNDGTALTSVVLFGGGFWNTAANWDSAYTWNTSSIWTLEEDKLPTLTGLAGQTGAPGVYLISFSTSALTVTPSETGISGSGISYSAPFSASARTVTVTVTGWDTWSNPAVTVTAKTPDNTALTVTPADTTNGSAAFTLPGNVSGAFTITAAAKSNPVNVNTTVTLTVAADPDIATVAAAKTAAENAPYSSMTQAAATSETVIENTLKATAETAVGNSSVTVTVNKASYTAPVAGTSANRAGTNGSYVFTVTVSKGAQTQTTVQKTIAVTATAYTGGSHSGRRSSYSAPKVTVTPTAQPDQPTIGSVTGKTAGTAAQAAYAVTDSIVKAALEKAQAGAKAQNRAAYGVSARIELDTPSAAELTVTLERAALNRLVSAGAKHFELTGTPISLSFDAQVLSELQKQGTGNVTITVKPATVTGVRNAYDLTLSMVKDGKAVSFTSLGGGSVTLSIPSAPGENEAAGYLYAVYVDAKGRINRIADSSYDTNSGSVICRTNHFSVYGVGYTAPSTNFTDVTKHWAKESIDDAVGRGLFGGTSDTAFSPNTAITRGILVTALGRLAGIDVKAYTAGSFTDVATDQYYAPYIEWAYKKGIVQGIGNRKFAPERAVTREEIAVIFTNYAKATGYTLPVTSEATAYADNSSIGSTCKTAVTAMQQAGIMMGGANNRFNPKSSATRAEVSAMLHRYIKLTIDPATAQGWAKNDAGQWLCYKDGKALTGWQTIDGVKYYFNANGTLKTGWVKDDSGSWHFYSGNKMLRGW